MLKHEDLEKFNKIFVSVSENPAHFSALEPKEILACEDGGMFGVELRRLSKSLEIASILGDVTASAALCSDLIAKNILENRCLSLDQAIEWGGAIRWAIAKMSEENNSDAPQQWYARQREVGLAGLRLRKAGYDVTVGAYGLRLSERSLHEASQKIDTLIRLIGGVQTANRLCEFVRSSSLIHDGMWLFGNRVPSYNEIGKPAVPLGWLLSLSLRHIGTSGSARKPDVAWNTLTNLAIDVAASFDCQRYGQFEQMDLHATQLHEVLSDSLTWREVFSLPQTPPLVLTRLQRAFKFTLTSDHRNRIGLDIDKLFAELQRIVDLSASDRLSTFDRKAVKSQFPLTAIHSIGEIGSVNREYLRPTGAEQRNHDSFVLFERGKSELVTMPRSFVTTAACETIFKLIWSKLESKDAARTVGRTFEVMIERACQGKAPEIIAGEAYEVGKQKFEIDVATREPKRVVIFETKAKSLTSRARSGDMFAFFSDYTDSYLSILKQLVRHEINMRAGLTSFPIEEDVQDNNRRENLTINQISEEDATRVAKVVVSPLSYGPVTDKLLASSILRSMVNISIFALDRSDKRATAVVEKLDKSLRSLIEDIAKVAPKRDGLADLFPYLLEVFWLDIGQLLYILDRSKSAWNALRPIMHMTFRTNDFWTEVAFADRQGISQEAWRRV